MLGGGDDRRLLGSGRSAEVFAWDGDTALRLFRSSGRGAVESAHAEAAAMRAARNAGCSVPHVHEVTTVDGRPGIVMDRVVGTDGLTLIGSRPWHLTRTARLTGTLHARLHRDVAAPSELPAVREQLRESIAASGDLIPADVAARALTLLEELPDGDRLCHGDFHPGNILLGEGDPVVIDWEGTARGDAEADVARSRVVIGMAAAPPDTPLPLRIMIANFRNIFLRVYLKAYRQTRSLDDDRLQKWFLVNAAQRIAEDIPGERDRLLAVFGRSSRSSGVR